MAKKSIKKPNILIPSYPKQYYGVVCSGKYSNLTAFYALRIRFWKSRSKKYRKAKFLASLIPNYTAPTIKNNYWTEISLDNERDFYVYFDVLYELDMLVYDWKYVEHYIGSEICYPDEFWVYMHHLNCIIDYPDLIRIDVSSKIHEFNDKWKHEKELFQIVENLFTDHLVERHYRASWLEGLELDIYIDDLKLAIEYQGIQHFKPMKHWGGEEGFIKRRLNDIRKKAFCEAQGITLIYFTYQDEITPELVLERLSHYS